MAIVKDKRILELALKGLEAERDRIGYEIAELRARLGGRIATSKRRRATKAIRKEVTETVSKALGKKKTRKRARRKMSASQKKLISEKMKAAWARRKKAGA